MTSEIGLLLGEALHEIGSTSRRRRSWPPLRRSRPTTIRSSLHIVEIRSRNLMWGLFRADEALEVNGLRV